MQFDKKFVDEIVRLQMDWTSRWHAKLTFTATEPLWFEIELTHLANFELWHLEDEARRDDIDFEWVRDAKRNIDRHNQSRHNAVEQIDAILLKQLPPANPGCPLHSETPGMMIDRLSILTLKFYHMGIEANRESAADAHRAECAARCAVLKEQEHDLKGCLERLLVECLWGTRRFKLYKQLKMYNDASLNPQLYK